MGDEGGYNRPFGGFLLFVMGENWSATSGTWVDMKPSRSRLPTRAVTLRFCPSKSSSSPASHWAPVWWDARRRALLRPGWPSQLVQGDHLLLPALHHGNLSCSTSSSPSCSPTSRRRTTGGRGGGGDEERTPRATGAAPGRQPKSREPPRPRRRNNPDGLQGGRRPRLAGGGDGQVGPHQPLGRRPSSATRREAAAQEHPAPDEESGDRSCLLFRGATRCAAAAYPWHRGSTLHHHLIIFSSIMLAIDDPRASDHPLKVFGPTTFSRSPSSSRCCSRSSCSAIRQGQGYPPTCAPAGISSTSASSPCRPLTHGHGAAQGLQALRTFRALRPLRLISRLERQVINTLLKSVPGLTLGVVGALLLHLRHRRMQLFAGRSARSSTRSA